MKTILLIEDDAAIRENTAELLELAGFAVLTAENGKLGVEQALATKPDLVVCDIMMPVLDGYGVLQVFNRNPRLAGVPFIFLTAKTERLDLRRGMELGADDYLTKPFDRAELLSAIAGRLGRFQHLRPEYDLQAGGLDQFLDDARAVGNLAGLSADRKAHSVRLWDKLAPALSSSDADQVGDAVSSPGAGGCAPSSVAGGWAASSPG